MSRASELTFAARVAVAEKIAALKHGIAAEVNHEFFRRHPNWETRYGAAGVQRGFEDACFHLDYLAAAVETASPALFENYGRWTGRMLESRGIAASFVVENFEQLDAALKARLTPEDYLCLQPCLRAGIEVLLRPVGPGTAETDPAESRQLFRTALLLGQRGAAVNIALDAIANGAGLADVYLDLCSKALWEIGELWQLNQISVADEHRATAIVQYVIAQIYARAPLQSLDRGRVVVTGVEGEMHQLGANIVADLLEAHGWNVCFLGTNLPQRAILQKIAEHRAIAVFISATMPFNLTAVRRLVAEIRRQFPPELRIILGGQAFAAAPTFYRDAGANAFAPTARDGAALITEPMVPAALGHELQEHPE